jgi:hypothetical protein
LARRFFKSQRDDKIRTSDREVFERLKVNSIQWYQASNTTLAEAVNTINAELGQQRVVFVSVEFPAAYSFAALQTHLWGFGFEYFGSAFRYATACCSTSHLARRKFIIALVIGRLLMKP